MSDKFGLEKKLKRLTAAKKTMPKVLGNMALNHFVKSFKDGGFTDRTLEKWQPRSKRAKRNTGRALLVDSGRLKRALRLKTATFDMIKISNAIKYAAIHNDGGTIKKKESSRSVSFGENDVTGRISFMGRKNYTTDVNGRRQKLLNRRSKMATIGAHDIKMPKRQFVGDSYQLKRNIKGEIVKTLNNVFIK